MTLERDSMKCTPRSGTILGLTCLILLLLFLPWAGLDAQTPAVPTPEPQAPSTQEPTTPALGTPAPAANPPDAEAKPDAQGADSPFAVPPPVTTQISPNLRRVEGIDPAIGDHYVRLLLSLSVEGNAERAPRFTVECDERKNKRDLLWFVSFGGVEDPGYDRRDVTTEIKKELPRFTAVDLKMRFEGYMKSTSFTRSWALPPGGEYIYRNVGPFSPNMDSPRYFMQYLLALPGLHISRVKQIPGQPEDLVFPTKPLLDEMNKTPACAA